MNIEQQLRKAGIDHTANASDIQRQLQEKSQARNKLMFAAFIAIFSAYCLGVTFLILALTTAIGQSSWWLLPLTGVLLPPSIMAGMCYDKLHIQTVAAHRLTQYCQRPRYELRRTVHNENLCFSVHDTVTGTIVKETSIPAATDVEAASALQAELLVQYGHQTRWSQLDATVQSLQDPSSIQQQQLLASLQDAAEGWRANEQELLPVAI